MTDEDYTEKFKNIYDQYACEFSDIRKEYVANKLKSLGIEPGCIILSKFVNILFDKVIIGKIPSSYSECKLTPYFVLWGDELTKKLMPRKDGKRGGVYKLEDIEKIIPSGTGEFKNVF